MRNHTIYRQHSMKLERVFQRQLELPRDEQKLCSKQQLQIISGEILVQLQPISCALPWDIVLHESIFNLGYFFTVLWQLQTTAFSLSKQVLTWKIGHIWTVYKGRNNTVAFHFTRENHRKRHAERAGAKYYESKVLGTIRKTQRETSFSGRYSLLCHLCQENPI